jgi:hypothetical protein
MEPSAVLFVVVGLVAGLLSGMFGIGDDRHKSGRQRSTCHERRSTKPSPRLSEGVGPSMYAGRIFGRAIETAPSLPARLQGTQKVEDVLLPDVRERAEPSDDGVGF